MARPLRIEYPGAVYHITGRGNARQNIFLCGADRNYFLDLLAKVNRRFRWNCHAFCLMDNHYHLVIETADSNLSRGMRQLGGVYTQAFNRRHNRVGHLFQGRYKAVLVEKESHLLETIRYVVLNPVRAGMVEFVDAWPWSSFSATVGMSQQQLCLKIDWILQQFSPDLDQARRCYRKFVDDGIGQHIWRELKGQTLLGREDFTDRLTAELVAGNERTEIPRSERLINRPRLKELFVEESRTVKQMRDQKMAEAVERYGYSQKDVADHLGLHYSTVSRLLASEMSKVKT